MFTGRRIKRIAAMTGLMTLSFLSGCGQAARSELVPPADMTYNSTEKTTATVEKGDLTYAFEYEITLSGYEEYDYRISNEKLAEMENVYDMKLDTVSATMGDHVKAGQTLIAFHSEELDEQLLSSRQNKELARLKLDHIARLAELEPNRDYTEQIKLLENECRVADLYVSDVQSIYSSFNITSDIDGIVTDMDPALAEGHIAPGKILFRIVKNDGYYVMDMGSKDSPTGFTAADFTPGDRLTAKGAASDYEVEVIETPEGREGETDLVFLKPVTGGDFLGESLKVTGRSATRKNICHVDKKAIVKTETGDYVLVRREDGEYEAVKVTVGDTLGLEVVITEGLSGGEQVALQ